MCGSGGDSCGAPRAPECAQRVCVHPGCFPVPAAVAQDPVFCQVSIHTPLYYLHTLMQGNVACIVAFIPCYGSPAIHSCMGFLTCDLCVRTSACVGIKIMTSPAWKGKPQKRNEKSQRNLSRIVSKTAIPGGKCHNCGDPCKGTTTSNCSCKQTS